MIINCPSCKTRYKVEPAQFGAKGRRVRCTACGNLWTQRPPEDFPQPVDLDAPLPEDAAEQASARRRAAWRAGGVRAAPEKKRGGALGWAALVMVVATVIMVGALAQESITRTWPPAQRLYTAIGFSATGPKSWLKLEVVSHDQAIKDGRTILILKGKVTNISDEVREVPKTNVPLREFVSRALDHGGHSVTTVEDGIQALAALAGGEFDLLLTDIVMPRMDGIALALKVVRDNFELPILLMSGYALERQKVHNLDALVYEVIVKPFTLREITDAVSTALKDNGKQK
jgi:two-component system cell cycle response regulator CpdR